jgi:hypothetical protein
MQPEDVVDTGDPRYRLPDAVGHGLAGTLDGLGGAVCHRRPAPVRAGHHADQFGDVKGTAELAKQGFEIAESPGVPKSHHPRVVGDGSVIPFPAKDRRAVCPVAL